MYELTESQALEVGGGMDGVPYDYQSQRVIVSWSRDPRDVHNPYEPPDCSPPSPIPSFGA